MRKITLGLFVLLVSCFSWQAMAQTYTAGDTPVSLGPNAGTVSTSIISVGDTGLIGTNPGDYTFDDLTMTLIHSWASDLDVTLTSPDGTVVTVFAADGGSSGLDTERTLVFTDASGNDVDDWNFGAPAADYQAEGGLLNTVFAGEDVNGDWTLSFTDNFNGDGGSLNAASISLGQIPIGSPPVISCPMDIMADTDPGECGAIVNFADAVALDAEDGPLTATQTVGPASGSQFPTGDTLIEYQVTDSDGNTASCTFTVTVMDTELPVAVCQDLTVEVDPMTGSVSITADDIDNGSTDNCGVASLSLDQSTFGCADTGENTVTLTVTDTSGNVSTCEATVTVEDNTAPVITCIGQPGTVTVMEDFDAGLPGDWSTVINSGTCDWQNGTDLPIGDDFATPGMFFDDDDCGSGADPSNVSLLSAVYDLTGSASASMSFDAAFQEIAGGETFTVEVWDGSAWQQVAFFDTDLDPDIQNVSVDVLAFANADFQVRWTYDDGGGTWGWHAGVDNFQLEYDVPASPLDLELDAMGMATISADDLILSADEACGYVVTVGGPATGGTQTTESLETTYAGGNGLDGAMFDVNVLNDVTFQTFNVNLDTGITVDMEVYYKMGTWQGFEEDPSAWTLIETTNVTSAGDGLPTPLGLNMDLAIAAGETVAFYVTSTSGGVNYTNGTTTGAVFASDDNIEFLEGSGKSYPFGASTFAPRIFNGDIIYDVGPPVDNDITFDCSQLGENQVEVFVTDNNGNFSSCIATVNVLDVTDPVLVCADTTIELGEDGTAEVDPMALLAVAPSTFEAMVIGSDNGSGSEGFTDFTVNVTDAASISFDWDYTTIDGAGFDSFGYVLNGTYTELTDPLVGNQSGNATIAVEAGDVFGFRSQTSDNGFGNNETVVSNFMPGFEGQFAPANWTLELTNSDGDAFFVEIPGGPLSFDACGIDVMAVDINEVTCADIGTPVEITVFASDASGNTAACTSIVTVVDALGPVITCPEDQSVDPGAEELFYEVPDYFATGEATATDNCTDPVTVFTQDPAAGELIPDGTYTVTLTAEDEYGNVSSCEFELTVESILGADDNDLGASIAMYPNPADTQVTIATRADIGLQSAVIYDINGRMVNEINLVGMQGEKVIDISTLASGVYAVKLNAESGTAVKRLIKK
ncbi:HYR domain-containing protein [Flavobacteriaceae bacterium TK19130]|nr:HYR domain-containing protein [Thermobacterium salinum]